MAKIMVVDDEPDIVILVKRILQREGHEVKGASGGHDALEKLNSFHPALILLDIMMPQIDGWETLTLIRQKEDFKDIPVSILTAKTLTPKVIERENIGELVHYLQKPITKTKLVDNVDQILRELKNIDDDHTAVSSKINDKVASIVYRNAARRELLHMNLSANLKDILGSAESETHMEDIKGAIDSQERMVDFFRKKREEIFQKND